MKVIGIFMLLIIITGCRTLTYKSLSDNKDTTNIDTTPIVYNPDYFGNHFHDAQKNPSVVSQFDNNMWRLWDTRTTWASLEPDKGNWKFDALDELVRIAISNNKKLILTLGQTPAWAAKYPKRKSVYGGVHTTSSPRDLNDWENYIRMVGTRYKGKIDFFEIWNEPDLYMFYTGTIDELVKMSEIAYNVLKEINPDCKILSPSITGWMGIPFGIAWLDLYLMAGGVKYIDIIGIHLYNDDYYKPEYNRGFISSVRSVLKKNKTGIPIWNTEGGYYNPTTAIENRPGIVARMIIINRLLGIDVFCWYAANNLRFGTLCNRETNEKYSSGVSYDNILRWLSGGTVFSVTCELGVNILKLSKDGEISYIMWTDSHIRQINSEKFGKTVYLLDGTSIAATKNLTLTDQPVMIK